MVRKRRIWSRPSFERQKFRKLVLAWYKRFAYIIVRQKRGVQWIQIIYFFCISVGFNDTRQSYFHIDAYWEMKKFYGSVGPSDVRKDCLRRKVYLGNLHVLNTSLPYSCRVPISDAGPGSVARAIRWLNFYGEWCYVRLRLTERMTEYRTMPKSWRAIFYECSNNPITVCLTWQLSNSSLSQLFLFPANCFWQNILVLIHYLILLLRPHIHPLARLA